MQDIAAFNRSHGHGWRLRGRRVRGADWSGMELRGAELRDVELSYVELTGAHLVDCQFIDCHMEGCNATAAVFEGCRFERLDDNHSEFSEGRLSACTFSEAKLWLTSFSGAMLKATTFSAGHLDDVSFANARTTDLHFEKTALTGVGFSGGSADGLVLDQCSVDNTGLNNLKISEHGEFATLSFDKSFVTKARFADTRFVALYAIDTTFTQSAFENCRFGKRLALRDVRFLGLQVANLHHEAGIKISSDRVTYDGSQRLTPD